MVDGVERERSREGQAGNDGDRSGNGESGSDVSLTLSILCYAARLYCTASADLPAFLRNADYAYEYKSENLFC